MSLEAGLERFSFLNSDLFILLYVYDGFACIYIYMHHVYVGGYSPRSEEGMGSSGTDPAYGCWLPNLCLLQEQVLLSTETFLWS